MLWEFIPEKSSLRYLKKFLSVIGVETRTSAPVRVNRDPETLASNVGGLYPCGEGAGYAGGIVSSAVDGLRVARAVAAALGADASGDVCAAVDVPDVA